VHIPQLRMTSPGSATNVPVNTPQRFLRPYRKYGSDSRCDRRIRVGEAGLAVLRARRVIRSTLADRGVPAGAEA
jgi:hypothetical protein